MLVKKDLVNSNIYKDYEKKYQTHSIEQHLLSHNDRLTGWLIKKIEYFIIYSVHV